MKQWVIILLSHTELFLYIYADGKRTQRSLPIPDFADYPYLFFFFLSYFFWDPIQILKSSEEYDTMWHGISNTFALYTMTHSLHSENDAHQVLQIVEHWFQLEDILNVFCILYLKKNLSQLLLKPPVLQHNFQQRNSFKIILFQR